MTKVGKNTMSEEFTPSETTLAVFGEYVVKLGRPVEDLVKMYADHRAVHDNPDKETEQFCDERARSYVRTAIRSELSSPAPTFDGIVMGQAAAFDTVAKHWNFVKELEKKPDQLEQALANGTVVVLVDPKTKEEYYAPVDMRETYSTGTKNRGYEKPYPRHSWLKNIIGVFGGRNVAPALARVTVNNRPATMLAPMYQPATVRLMNKTKEGETELKLGGSSVTEFRLSANENVPSAESLIQEHFAPYYSSLAEILDHHVKWRKGFKTVGGKKREDLDYSRLTLVDVYFMHGSEEVNSNGTYRITVEDDSLGVGGDGEEIERGMGCWVPEDLWDMPNVRGETLRDVGTGTRMFLIGQTAQPQQTRNFQTQEMDDIPGDVNLTVLGAIIQDGYFYAKEVVEDADSVVVE